MKITYTLDEVCDIIERHSLESYDTYNVLSTAKCHMKYDDTGEITFEVTMAGPYEKAPE